MGLRVHCKAPRGMRAHGVFSMALVVLSGRLSVEGRMCSSTPPAQLGVRFCLLPRI